MQAIQEAVDQEVIQQEGEESRQEEDPGGNPPSGSSRQPPPPPPQQSGGASQPSGHPGAPSGPQSAHQAHRKSLPQFKLPSNYKSCSILDMQQMLEDGFNKLTFAIATWRGDAQRYWLDQVLETARAWHEQWLQNSPEQRASLEPAYILGDRKLIPEAVNAVESVLRTELLDVIPKPIADSCMRHGYCTAELIIWYIMKQLILPPVVNEVTKKKEILTPLRIPPLALDQASKWLEEMQHRLNLHIKTKQNVHPRALVAFVIETISAVIQYYCAIGNIWDTLYAKHQLRDSDITLDRVYSMLSELLIELKLNEEQERTTQIVTGSGNTQMKPSVYDKYVHASKGKVQSKGKGKGGEAKSGKRRWRQPYNDYWRPDGCQHH